LDKLDIFRTQLAGITHIYENSRALAKKLREIAEDELDFAELIEAYAFPFLFKGIPFVVKMHGAEWTVRHYCEDKPYLRLLVRLEARMLRAARRVFAVSRAHADFIAGACQIPPRLIQVVRYPSDLEHFSVAPPPPQSPPFRLMYVGRLERRKGIHTLIEAMRVVWKHEPQTYLYLYGSEGDFGRQQIEAAMPQREHQGRIRFEGFIPRDQLIQRYQQAHLCVAPTRYETSGGYHIQEAACCGRPVIASDIGSVAELVRHGETGWLVPRDDVGALADAILYGLQNPNERERLGEAAREFSRTFDIDRVMQHQLKLYEQVVRS
jgi:glycosyltransferase involved in cell wall biosynthesis